MGKLTTSKDENDSYASESLGRSSLQHNSATPSRGLHHSTSHKSMHSMSSSHDFSAPARRQTVSTATAPVPAIPKVFNNANMPSLSTEREKKVSIDHPREASDSSLLSPAEPRKPSQSGQSIAPAVDEDKYSAPSSMLS